MKAFWADETGFDTGRKLPPRLAKFGLLILVINEIRGLIVASTIAREMFF